jgi:hypothetical protein
VTLVEECEAMWPGAGWKCGRRKTWRATSLALGVTVSLREQGTAYRIKSSHVRGLIGEGVALADARRNFGSEAADLIRLGADSHFAVMGVWPMDELRDAVDSAGGAVESGRW